MARQRRFMPQGALVHRLVRPALAPQETETWTGCW